MKNKTFNPIATLTLVLVLLSSISFSQSKDNPNAKMKTHKKMDNMNMMDSCKIMDNKTMPDSCIMKMNDPEHKKMMKNMKSKMKSSMKTKMRNKSSMVRKGIIDLKSIDTNKDGFVYQDRMDWNVISDNPDTCTLCGMKLKKYSLKQTRKNLIENGYNVK